MESGEDRVQSVECREVQGGKVATLQECGEVTKNDGRSLGVHTALHKEVHSAQRHSALVHSVQCKEAQCTVQCSLAGGVLTRHPQEAPPSPELSLADFPPDSLVAAQLTRLMAPSLVIWLGSRELSPGLWCEVVPNEL